MDADFLLLHRMRHGDDQAIEDFVRKYYPMILRYCQLHIQDLGYAEDLTQETFARFFRTLNQYQHYGKAANYLYVIAGNLCRDHHKKPDKLRCKQCICIHKMQKPPISAAAEMGGFVLVEAPAPSPGECKTLWLTLAQSSGCAIKNRFEERVCSQKVYSKN